PFDTAPTRSSHHPPSLPDALPISTLALPENTAAINQSYNPSAGVKKPRYQSGTVTGADKLPNVQTMMRGTHGNIGVIPKEVGEQDRKSTRLNSSHVSISYAVLSLK